HRQALALRLEHVSHLVHEEEDDQADPEPPAAEPDVERGRDEDREQELELEQRRAELEQERTGRDQRREELAQEREARLVPHRFRRLVVRKLCELLAFLRGQLGHTTHGTQVAYRQLRAEIAPK